MLANCVLAQAWESRQDAGGLVLFAVRSSINVTFAISGAGCVSLLPACDCPGYRMSSSRRGRAYASLAFRSFALCILLCPLTEAGATDGFIAVIVDQAKLIKLPEKVATIVVGNPLIADVTLQPGGMVVVTGKGYGATNMIAMDRNGSILVDRVIQVEGPTDKLVTVYRGTDRETYSCTPVCQRRVTLGDATGYFSSTLDQGGTLSTQAGNAGSAAPPPAARQ